MYEKIGNDWDMRTLESQSRYIYIHSIASAILDTPIVVSPWTYKEVDTDFLIPELICGIHNIVTRTGHLPTHAYSHIHIFTDFSPIQSFFDLYFFFSFHESRSVASKIVKQKAHFNKKCPGTSGVNEVDCSKTWKCRKYSFYSNACTKLSIG